MCLSFEVLFFFSVMQSFMQKQDIFRLEKQNKLYDFQNVVYKTSLQNCDSSSFVTANFHLWIFLIFKHKKA